MTEPIRLQCTKGHTIHTKDIKASNGMTLACGCPAASIEGCRSEGLPDHGALFQVPIGSNVRAQAWSEFVDGFNPDGHGNPR